MYKPVFSANKVHPTERPIELMQDILQTFGHMGANVLVPFLGSGNTLLAAANLNMKAFGFDLSPEYKSEYILKVGSNRAPGYKSYKEVVNE
jgi:DNA modification methylase